MLKEKLLSSYVANPPSSNNAYVLKEQAKAIAFFETKGFPTKKEEEWKYTNLLPILKRDYSLLPEKEKLELEDVKKYFIEDMDSSKIVFVNGIYSSSLSDTTNEGYDFCLMSTALTDPKYKEVIEKHFNQAVPKDETLISLNTAFASEGAYIHVSKNTVVNKPIQLIYFSVGKEEVFTQPRNLVIVEENAQVQIIERHQNLTGKSVLTNSVTEIFADKNANVDYYKIQNDDLKASLLDATFVKQQENSHCSVHTFSFGGQLTRNNLYFYQEGKHCNSILNGFSILSEEQMVDNHTLVHHKSEDCESHENYKGIYNGKSRGVFNGKIKVDSEAQRINAYQQNDNVLLTDTVRIASKPQLEIFADDVRCSHGCTIGQIEEAQLFYLQSRGIPKKEAEALMMYAFTSSVLDSVRIPSLKKRINRHIATKLGVNVEFAI